MTTHSNKEMENIKQIMNRHSKSLMAIPGVIGIGIGETKQGELCIRVLVTQKRDEIEKQLPAELDGYNVEIQETGPIEAL